MNKLDASGPDDQDAVTRRRFFQQVAAAGVLAAAGQIPQALAQSNEKTYLGFLAALDQERRELRRLDVANTLKHGSPDEAFEVILQHAFSPDLRGLHDTPADTRPLEKHSVLVGKDRTGKLKVLDIRKPEDMHVLIEANQGNMSYGVGIPLMDTGLTLLNKHVADEILSQTPDIRSRGHSFLDINVANLEGQYYSPDQLVTLPKDLKDGHVDKEWVVMTGPDPDATAMSTSSVTGQKTFGGFAFKLTEPLIQKIKGSIWWQPWKKSAITPLDEAQLRNSFAMLLPVDQALKTFIASQRVVDEPIKGMSGSPVFVWRNNKYEFCGNFYVVYIRHRGKTHALAIFQGPEALNASMKEFLGLRQ